MAKNTGIDKKIAQIDNVLRSEFNKYFVHSEMDHKWGMMISDVGHSSVPPNSDYPTKGHPISHMFSWDRGRILNEYQIVLITQGAGTFESESSGDIKLNRGDGFIIFPGEWHRYKPMLNTGWTEIWVGFHGKIADIIMKDYFFQKSNPVIPNCSKMLVMNLFTSIFQLMIDEPYGYQKAASSICMQLVAEIHNIQNRKSSAEVDNSIISKAKYVMQKRIDKTFDLELFCNSNGISYSKFRSDFKYQTGLAPMQYYILLKIEKAKYLISNTDLRAKEIAFLTGFNSEHYFCRLFKKKTGYSTKAFKLNKGLINSSNLRDNNI
ncbi:AraC family transcriptional regulator [Algibacter sp. R77976]|uniref:AraC family transcriptional regulator n=1 Tax=Algibacter sp. R77976 TaxID=3093873 RepID=UPI0037C8583F